MFLDIARGNPIEDISNLIEIADPWDVTVIIDESDGDCRGIVREIVELSLFFGSEWNKTFCYTMDDIADIFPRSMVDTWAVVNE